METNYLLFRSSLLQFHFSPDQEKMEGYQEHLPRDYLLAWIILPIS